MNQSDWYAKLLEWSHTDKRLGRLPYVLMVVLAEHLAERDAAEQNMHPTCGSRRLKWHFPTLKLWQHLRHYPPRPHAGNVVVRRLFAGSMAIGEN